MCIQGQHRQGDVLVENAPRQYDPKADHLKKGDKGEVVLAEGEVTGHNHVISGEVAEFTALSGERLLFVEAPAPLDHVVNGVLTGDHGSHVIETGVKVVIQQRQYEEVAPVRVTD